MENNDFIFDVLYTDEMLVQLSKHVIDLKRKRLLVYFFLLTVLSAFLIVLYCVGSDTLIKNKEEYYR